MKRLTQSVAEFALVLLALVSIGCKSGPDVIFVREDLDLDGEPRQVLKIVEPTTVSAAYFNGEEWIVVDGVSIPNGWLVVSPALADPKPNPEKPK